MNLIIDIGNTAIKVAFLNTKGDVLQFSSFKTLEFKEAIHFTKSQFYNKAILSSVGPQYETQEIIKGVKNLIVFDKITELPFTILYATPHSLGKDRIANAAGAFSRFPNQNTLVIDAGTCLKFDIINDKAEYLGGSISPGLTMRLKALHTFTANLPLLENYTANQPLIGNDTSSSMLVGSINGMKNEIIRTIEEYQKEFSNLNIILTGGESHFFENVVISEKNSIFADSFLTLKGLNTILNYNAKNN
jgi:type III pantothenate kinase